jgi:hypothetical protein
VLRAHEHVRLGDKPESSRDAHCCRDL